MKYKECKLTATNWLFSMRMMSPTTTLCQRSSTSLPPRNTRERRLFTWLSLRCRCYKAINVGNYNVNGCFSEKGYHMGWPDSKTNYKFVIHPLEEIPIKSWLLNMWEITIITTKVFHVVVLVWKPIFVCQMWRFSIAILWHEPATIKQLTRIPTTLSYFHCKHFIY